MKKIPIVLLLPVLPLVISYITAISKIQNCPAGWPTLMPCFDAPIVEQRGFPYFYENGNLITSNLLIAYLFWLVVVLAVFGIILITTKLLGKKHRNS